MSPWDATQMRIAHHPQKKVGDRKAALKFGWPAWIAAIAIFAGATTMEILIPLEASAEPATVCDLFGIWMLYLGSDSYFRERQRQQHRLELAEEVRNWRR